MCYDPYRQGVSIGPDRIARVTCGACGKESQLSECAMEQVESGEMMWLCRDCRLATCAYCLSEERLSECETVNSIHGTALMCRACRWVNNLSREGQEQIWDAGWYLADVRGEKSDV